MIVGVVKLSVLEKEDMAVMAHLNAGLDKLAPDISSRVFWTNELLQLIQGPIKSACRLAITFSPIFLDILISI